MEPQSGKIVEVVKFLDAVEKSTMALRETWAGLAARLTPVSSPEAAKDTGEAKRPEVGSIVPVAARLAGILNVLDAMRDEMADATSRLEI